MKRPWMPLYIADYLTDTTHLRASESGAYLHMLMHYWMHGGLPDDDTQLATIAKMTHAEWHLARPTLAQFFQPGWIHKRVEKELKRMADISQQRRRAANNKWRKHADTTNGLDANAYANTMQNGCDDPMQNDATSHSTLRGSPRKKDS